MIKFSATFGGSDNSASVVPELGRVSIDGHRDDTLGNGSLKLSFALRFDVMDFTDGNGTVVLGEARVRHGEVGVIRLEADTTVVLHIVEAVILPATAAAH